MKRFIFALLLVLSIGMVVHAQDDPTPISIGDTVNGELTEASPAIEYIFEANADDSLLIDLTADFDTYLFLYDRNGVELTRNDDGGEGLNSRITGFVIPTSGTYIIRATSFSYRDGSGGSVVTGDFSLTLDILEVTPIEYGQTRTGTSTGFIGLFQFNAEAGTTIAALLNLDGDNYDNELTLTGPNGVELSYGNYVDGRTTTIGPIVLEEAGTYTLSATGTGDYALSLERVESTPVRLGQSVTATFDERNQTLYFSFEATSSTQVVDIIVDSGNTIDSTMTLTGPYNYEYASNEDADGTVDPALFEEVLNDTGTYMITLRAQNPNARLNGDVLFTIRPAELASLEEGTVTLNLGNDNDERLLVFEGVAGETVRLTVEVIGGESYATPYIELSQDGSSFSTFNLNGVTRIVADIPISSSGTVNVSVQSYSRISLNITFERLGQ